MPALDKFRVAALWSLDNLSELDSYDSVISILSEILKEKEAHRQRCADEQKPIEDSWTQAEARRQQSQKKYLELFADHTKAVLERNFIQDKLDSPDAELASLKERLAAEKTRKTKNEAELKQIALEKQVATESIQNTLVKLHAELKTKYEHIKREFQVQNRLAKVETSQKDLIETQLKAVNGKLLIYLNSKISDKSKDYIEEVTRALEALVISSASVRAVNLARLKQALEKLDQQKLIKKGFGENPVDKILRFVGKVYSQVHKARTERFVTDAFIKHIQAAINAEKDSFNTVLSPLVKSLENTVAPAINQMYDAKELDKLPLTADQQRQLDLINAPYDKNFSINMFSPEVKRLAGASFTTAKETIFAAQRMIDAAETQEEALKSDNDSCDIKIRDLTPEITKRATEVDALIESNGTSLANANIKIESLALDANAAANAAEIDEEAAKKAKEKLNVAKSRVENAERSKKTTQDRLKSLQMKGPKGYAQEAANVFINIVRMQVFIASARYLAQRKRTTDHGKNRTLVLINDIRKANSLEKMNAALKKCFEEKRWWGGGAVLDNDSFNTFLLKEFSDEKKGIFKLRSENVSEETYNAYPKTLRDRLNKAGDLTADDLTLSLDEVPPPTGSLVTEITNGSSSDRVIIRNRVVNELEHLQFEGGDKLGIKLSPNRSKPRVIGMDANEVDENEPAMRDLKLPEPPSLRLPRVASNSSLVSGGSDSSGRSSPSTPGVGSSPTSRSITSPPSMVRSADHKYGSGRNSPSTPGVGSSPTSRSITSPTSMVRSADHKYGSGSSSHSSTLAAVEGIHGNMQAVANEADLEIRFKAGKDEICRLAGSSDIYFSSPKLFNGQPYIEVFKGKKNDKPQVSSGILIPPEESSKSDGAKLALPLFKIAQVISQKDGVIQYMMEATKDERKLKNLLSSNHQGGSSGLGNQQHAVPSPRIS